MTVRSLFFKCLLVVAALASAPAGLSTAQAQITPDDAKKFIQSMGDQAIQILSQQDATLAQREDKFRDILRDGFAIPLIGQFVSGNYWKQASPDQQREYLTVFSEWIVKTYAIRFGGYSGEKFNVADTKINEQDKDVFVGTRIDRPAGKQPILATWRVRSIEGRPKIVDVQVDGVSMLVTHRAEFGSVGAQGGMNGIIDSLKGRIAKLAQTAG